MAGASVFGKLQLKDQSEIVVLDAPETFAGETDSLEGVRIHRKFVPECGFWLAFMSTRAQLDRFAKGISSRCTGDELVWVAYPKGTSKRYESELSRDGGWKPLDDLGYETVRMVAIDEDWSALRFRKTGFVGRKVKAK
jgi:hypothetical protein